MNMVIKGAVAAALALGASGAYAIGLPSSDNSDLILVVDNTTTNATYLLDTGISLSSVMPGGFITSSVLSTALAGINATIAASPTLQAFLAANPASGDGWTLMGGQFNGALSGNIANNTSTRGVGSALVIFSSQIGTVNAGSLQNETLGKFQSYLNGLQNDVASAQLGGATQLFSGLLTATEVTGTGLLSANAASKYGTFGTASDLGPVGGTQTFFGFTGNGGTGNPQSYILGTVTLSANGTLTIVGNQTTAPVPLPAAVWLFGSGLMGLVGVSRRRKEEV